MTEQPPAATKSGPSSLQLVGLGAAAALVPLNSTMIAVALPEIADDFDVPIGEASVLITVYLVAMLIGQPLAGRFSDNVGTRRMLTWGLVGFAICSVGAALAATFPLLVVARAAQALCGAAVAPTTQSLLRAITPAEDQGRSFGILGSMIGIGAAAGPVIGGALTALFGWAAIFLVNLPIVALALYAIVRMGPVAEKAVEPKGPVEGRIWNKVYTAAFSGQALTTLAQYTLLLLTPIILDARGWGSGSIGLALSALTFGMIVFGPLGGRAGDRYGRRTPVTLGFAVATGAVVVILLGGAGIEPVLLIAALTVFGIGLGGAIPSVTTAALQSVPMERTGAAAGVLSMSRYVGSITTSLIIAVSVADDASGSRVSLAVSAVAMVGAVAVARVLPGRD